MNDLFTDVRFWFTAMGLGLLGFVKLLWAKQEKRLEKLEGDVVRRAEFDQLREDFQLKHEENGGKLDTIVGLIERNHADAVQGRHNTANQILTLVEKVGTIQGRMGLDEFKVRDR